MAQVPEEVTRYAQRMGRKGGQTRAARLSPAKRSALSRKAARARWAKQKSAKG